MNFVYNDTRTPNNYAIYADNSSTRRKLQQVFFKDSLIPCGATVAVANTRSSFKITSTCSRRTVEPQYNNMPNGYTIHIFKLFYNFK